jgi:hypothetical protein
MFNSIVRQSECSHVRLAADGSQSQSNTLRSSLFMKEEVKTKLFVHRTGRMARTTRKPKLRHRSKFRPRYLLTPQKKNANNRIRKSGRRLARNNTTDQYYSSGGHSSCFEGSKATTHAPSVRYDFKYRVMWYAARIPAARWHAVSHPNTHGEEKQNSRRWLVLISDPHVWHVGGLGENTKTKKVGFFSLGSKRIAGKEVEGKNTS